jgi:succinate dehydrogenase/fumarate reductase flavoprotein subunit
LALATLAAPRDQIKHGAKLDGGAAALMKELQALMWDKVGLFRTADALAEALARIRGMRRDDMARMAIPDDAPFNQALLDWYELRAGLLCAEAVTLSAINRTESRGAHQREDIPDASPDFERNQTIILKNGELVTDWADVPRISYTLENKKAAVV